MVCFYLEKRLMNWCVWRNVLKTCSAKHLVEKFCILNDNYLVDRNNFLLITVDENQNDSHNILISKVLTKLKTVVAEKMFV